MTVCKHCSQEMSAPETTTCTADTHILIKRKAYERVPYEPDYGGKEIRCHDCGIARGGLHHPGCDMERCARCEGQRISCDCKRRV